MSDHVQIGRDGAVQTVRLNRADKKNSLTGEMYGALAAALAAPEKDETIAVTVILGQPGIFCAGNDLADFLAAAQSGGALHAGGFISRLPDSPVPLVAVIDGLAIGVGTTLTFHCDLVYASERAVFQTPFVNLGLVPEAASSLIGPRLMGQARAFELLVMGEPFSAHRAYEAGFVNHIVPSHELEAAAMKAAHAIAKKPREAVRLSRQLLRGDVSEIRQRMTDESKVFAERIASDEARAAFQAFLQRPHKAAAE